eukprot:scaffold8959_cov109-Cylindrotheca_fusiformis.AAC.2
MGTTLSGVASDDSSLEYDSSPCNDFVGVTKLESSLGLTSSESAVDRLENWCSRVVGTTGMEHQGGTHPTYEQDKYLGNSHASPFRTTMRRSNESETAIQLKNASIQNRNNHNEQTTTRLFAGRQTGSSDCWLSFDRNLKNKTYPSPSNNAKTDFMRDGMTIPCSVATVSSIANWIGLTPGNRREQQKYESITIDIIRRKSFWKVWSHEIEDSRSIASREWSYEDSRIYYKSLGYGRSDPRGHRSQPWSSLFNPKCMPVVPKTRNGHRETEQRRHVENFRTGDPTHFQEMGDDVFRQRDRHHPPSHHLYPQDAGSWPDDCRLSIQPGKCPNLETIQKL